MHLKLHEVIAGCDSAFCELPAVIVYCVNHHGRRDWYQENTLHELAGH